MLSEKSAMEILNSGDKQYNLAEVKVIKKYLEEICNIEYEIIQQEKDSENCRNLY
ncbi:MAG: hypothetical protein ACI9S8_002049 [Chlamydiales bacterium]|jgi:hypothetical protein